MGTPFGENKVGEFVSNTFHFIDFELNTIKMDLCNTLKIVNSTLSNNLEILLKKKSIS